MKFVSTRTGIEATGPETVFQGLASDGGLYVPAGRLCSGGIAELKESDSSQANSSMVNGESHNSTIPQSPSLAQAESFVLGRLFDDFPEEVRSQAVDRLLSRFPEGDPIPLVDAGGFKILELFHGRTGAFKDVALSMLPVFMRHASAGRRTLVLTATSGDTGSAAMQGFAGVAGTEVVVFFPDVGTSRIQRLQMTTPSAANVHAVAIRGNFDDAQAAVKRIFAAASINARAAAAGINLSSANSINTGRLVPQIAYYILAGAKLRLCNYGNVELRNSGIAELKEADSSQASSSMVNREFHNSIIPQFHNPTIPQSSYDVVVPSGNFGNILAAYYAKLMGAPIGRFVVASNVNDVLARFVKTGVYDPGDKFTVTNSPSMDIRRSSNVERLLWLLSGGLDGDVERACAETSRMMRDLAEKGSYELSASAKERLFADFDGGVATPEETEAEMRLMRDESDYLVDPHTAVATFVARRLGYPKDAPCVVAATATPYKFPETCRRAFGADVLDDPPPSFRELETLPVAQTRVCDVADIDHEVTRLFSTTS